MVDLDLSLLPRAIATMLQLRGTGLAPLQMQDGANRGAKATLDSLESCAELFNGSPPADETMAAAVQAMLYLWNGWPEDCAMLAQAVPQAERFFLEGICARQCGRAEAAKAAFQGLDGHPTYTALATHARDAIGMTRDTALTRFKQLLVMVGEWEPFAFVDLYEQARAGQLSAGAERTVRSMQCKEFELLFVHYFERASGQALPERPAKEDTSNIDKLRELKRARRTTSKQRADTAAKNRAATAVAPPPAPATLKILCPKCQAEVRVTEASRGKQAQCNNCRVRFLVPAVKGQQPAGAQPTVGIRCPQCCEVLVLPAVARGTKKTCGKCGARFLVPG